MELTAVAVAVALVALAVGLVMHATLSRALPSAAADVRPVAPVEAPPVVSPLPVVRAAWTGPVVPMRMTGCDTEIALLDYWRARAISRALRSRRRRVSL